MSRSLDRTDLGLLAALRSNPKASHAELARDVGIARGTVYSRLDRLEAEGVIAGYGPDVDAARSGLGVLAFTTLEISQGSHDEAVRALAAIVEVIEVNTVTGSGDLLCRIVARSNDHLHDVLQRVADVPTVQRSESQLALATAHRRAVIDVVLSTVPTT